MKTKRYLTFTLFILFLHGNVFSQNLDRVESLVKTSFDSGGSYGLGLELGSFNKRKIKIYCDFASSESFKGSKDNDIYFVIVDELTGNGSLIDVSDWDRSPNFWSWLDFCTVNKKISENEWSGGQSIQDILTKLLKLKPRHYTLNRTVVPTINISFLDNHGDSSKNEVLKWLVNNNLFGYSGGEMKGLRQVSGCKSHGRLVQAA